MYTWLAYLLMATTASAEVYISLSHTFIELDPYEWLTIAQPLRHRHRHEARSAAAEGLVLSHSTDSGNLLDEFIQSNLNFGQWIDQMVEDGHLLRPSDTDVSFIHRGEVIGRGDKDGWTVKLKHVACSTISGNGDLLERAESHFCDKFTKNAEEMMAKQLELDVTEIICKDGPFCKLGLRTVFDLFGWFQEPDDMTKICHEAFDAVRNACPGGGGIAEAEVVLKSGESTTGLVQSSYSLDDSMHCQEGKTQECFVKDIPA